MSLLDIATSALNPWKWGIAAVGLVVTITTAGLWLHARDQANFQRGATEANAAVAARDVIQARAAVDQANKNAAITVAREKDKDDATVQRDKNQTAAGVHSAAAASELGRLRNDLATARAALDGAVSSSSCAPYREAIATRDAVLDAMGTAGAGMAGAAQGHADDALMYQQAWPKN